MSEKNQTTGDTQISTHENLIATKLIEQGFYYDGIDNKQQSIVTIVDEIKKNPSTLMKNIISESNIQLLKDIINNHSISIKLDTFIPKISSIINDLLQMTNIQDTGGVIRNELVQKYISNKVNNIQRNLPGIVQLVKMGNPDYIGHTDENYNEELMNIRKKLINETVQYTGNNIEEKIQAYEILESCIPYLTKIGSETREKLMEDEHCKSILGEVINHLVAAGHNNASIQSCIVGLYNFMPYETFQQIINKLDNNSTTKSMEISFVIMRMCTFNSAYNIGNKVSDKNINKFIEFISDLGSYEEENKIFQYSDLLNELISSSPNTGIGLLYQLNPNHPLLQQLDTWEKEQVITSNNIRFLNVLFHGSTSEAAGAVNIYNMFYLNEQLGSEKISEILKLIDVADYSNYEARIHKEFNALNIRNKHLHDHLDIENILMKGTPESIAHFINNPSKLQFLNKITHECDDDSVNLVEYYKVK